MRLKERFKRNEGITLIAIVITIIVLLILAGISISMLTSQNSILNRAVEAKEKTGTSNAEEQRKLAQAEALTNIEETTYKGITIPEGFAPTGIEGEDSVDEGLVITDKYGNEYVWIEVPKTTTVYPTAGINIAESTDGEFTEEEYTKIWADLTNYVGVYPPLFHNDKKYINDIYYPDSTEGWFEDENAYNTAKKKMLKSVYQNGGFWVGRYEAGIEENRTEEGDATTKPLSKENLYPYTYVTRTQAKVLAEKVESGSYTSSLMFGVQWDLVLKYIETKNPAQKSNLLTNSTTIGNYRNSEFTINRGEFAHFEALPDWKAYNSEEKSTLVTGSQKKSQSSYKNGILLTTGATEATNLQNIYDIAGNVMEWTLEKTYDACIPSAYRGGVFWTGGSDYPASARIDYGTSEYDYDIGFRLSLY